MKPEHYVKIWIILQIICETEPEQLDYVNN